MTDETDRTNVDVLTLRLLEQIRDELRTTREELGSRIEQTRDELGARIDQNREELGSRIENLRRETGHRLQFIEHAMVDLAVRVTALEQRGG